MSLRAAELAAQTSVAAVRRELLAEHDVDLDSIVERAIAENPRLWSLETDQVQGDRCTTRSPQPAHGSVSLQPRRRRSVASEHANTSSRLDLMGGSVLRANEKRLILDLIADLVAGRFDEIVADGRAARHRPDDLREAVREYGRTLVDPPDAVWEVADVDRIDEKTIYADVPMWTREEGRSDLEAIIVLTRSPTGELAIELEDLHVP